MLRRRGPQHTARSEVPPHQREVTFALTLCERADGLRKHPDIGRISPRAATRRRLRYSRFSVGRLSFQTKSVTDAFEAG